MSHHFTWSTKVLFKLSLQGKFNLHLTLETLSEAELNSQKTSVYPKPQVQYNDISPYKIMDDDVRSPEMFDHPRHYIYFPSGPISTGVEQHSKQLKLWILDQIEQLAFRYLLRFAYCQDHVERLHRSVLSL